MARLPPVGGNFIRSPDRNRRLLAASVNVRHLLILADEATHARPHDRLVEWTGLDRAADEDFVLIAEADVFDQRRLFVIRARAAFDGSGNLR